MRFIEHIVEPDRLLLSWQGDQPGPDRRRMFVADLLRRDDDADLVYLTGTDDFARAQELGFKQYPGFNSERQEHKNVLPSFMKRLPPRRRKDFPRFMGALRLRADSQISDFALLGYATARLPDDQFSVIHPFDNAGPPFELMVAVQGYRYHLDAVPYSTIETNLPASFEKESDNPQDSQAIRILINGAVAGYVCRGLVSSFHSWLDKGYRISASIERINGVPENPKIFLFVSVRT